MWRRVGRIASLALATIRRTREGRLDFLWERAKKSKNENWLKALKKEPWELELASAAREEDRKQELKSALNRLGWVGTR